MKEPAAVPILGTTSAAVDALLLRAGPGRVVIWTPAGTYSCDARRFAEGRPS